MQGDIMMPLPPRRKASPKPKPSPPNLPAETDPAIAIDESADEEPSKEGRLLIAPHKHFVRFWRWWLSLGRNQRFAIIAGLLLVFGAIAVGWYNFIQPDSNPSLTFIHHKKKPKVPATIPSPLTGLPVDPALAKRPVTGIMIENSNAARPQSGLQDAGVVYEAVAEAGITRFLALFQDATPQYIGPVRSLRPYYIDYAAGFQASIVHVGGSPDALAKVRSGGYRNLDEFANGSYFYRVRSRAAPHNVYTDFTKLDALNQKKGYTGSTFTAWQRKADKKPAAPSAAVIDFTISSPDYYAHYDYQAATNSYLRKEGGAPHTDYVSAADRAGVQLHPKVVIGLVVPQSLGALDATGAYYTDYDTSGSGTAYIFQDGGVTIGSWTKADSTTQISFTNSNGTPLKLNAGQTWITLVGSTGKINYKP
jgi:hypothetical protein